MGQDMTAQETPRYWMVTAKWSDRDPADQTSRFRREHVWENNWDDGSEKLFAMVRQMRRGDRIAIQEYAPQAKGDLPFKTSGESISCLLVKATGTVTNNPGDGRHVDVEWDPAAPEDRPWYGYTYKHPIWLRPQGKELADKLIAFAFHDEPQDTAWFEKEWTRPPSRVKPSLTEFGDLGDPTSEDTEELSVEANAYGIRDILAAGIFMPQGELERTLRRWRSKKNVILQGPPGVGKTFLARHLAYALMQEKAPDRVNMVQFHQS